MSTYNWSSETFRFKAEDPIKKLLFLKASKKALKSAVVDYRDL